MLRTLVLGVLLSIVVGLLVRFAPLGLDATSAVVLGACLGAVLAMNVDREPWQRALAFGAGLGLAWVGYAARAELLPDAPNGRAIAAFVVLLLVTALSVGTAGRLPLWAGLLGVGGFSGAYEVTFLDQPETFEVSSLVALSTFAFASGAGYAVCVVVAEMLPSRVAVASRHVVDVREPARRAVPPPAQPGGAPPAGPPAVPTAQPSARPSALPTALASAQAVGQPQLAMRGPRVIDPPRERRS